MAVVESISAGWIFCGHTKLFYRSAVSGYREANVIPRFYSAAPLPRPTYTLWIFAAVDGQVHLLDGLTDQAARLNWGSDVASVKTSCGSGWQVLATQPGETRMDSVRAYEFADRDPVAVSQPVNFGGGITALWTETKGATAIVIARNAERRNYEAFRLAIACGQ